MDDQLVHDVRRFNRTVTQRLRVLDEEYLARGRPFGQARLLWEIGRDGCQLRTLRSRLDLDSGYLSRLLAALQADGLVELGVDAADRRIRRAYLTPAGISEREELDRRSDELVAGILEPLGQQQRHRLAAAMREVEGLVTASMVQVVEMKPGHPYVRFCLESYFAELAERVQGGFDPKRARPLHDDEITPPAGVLLVATLHDEPVGCGALKRGNGSAAEIKRMWISPAVRGLGLGRRLLAELETRARGLGVQILRLDTNRGLSEAIALYRSAGFREVSAFNDEPHASHWFEKSLLD